MIPFIRSKRTACSIGSPIGSGAKYKGHKVHVLEGDILLINNNFVHACPYIVPNKDNQIYTEMKLNKEFDIYCCDCGISFTKSKLDFLKLAKLLKVI